jgi:hypothetical protein
MWSFAALVELKACAAMEETRSASTPYKHSCPGRRRSKTLPRTGGESYVAKKKSLLLQ